MSQSRSVEEILQRLYAQIDDEGLRHDYDGAELSQHGRQLIAAALRAYGEQVAVESANFVGAQQCRACSQLPRPIEGHSDCWTALIVSAKLLEKAVHVYATARTETNKRIASE
jgi:hypothetical protein